MAPVAVPPTDVQIVGTAYSGSTLLANALNAHAAVAHVGEVSSMPGFDVGVPESDCHLCSSNGSACPVWNASTRAVLAEQGPARSFDVLRRVTGSPIVIDSSKWVPWLHLTHPQERGSTRAVRAILSVRNPLAYVNSVVNRDGVEPWQAANTWRDTIFDAVRSVGALSVPVMIVRYEEFARDPRAALLRVCGYLGVDWDEGMLEFWNVPAHALGGNAGAFVWYPGYVHRGLRSDPGTWSAADADVADAYRARGFGGWTDTRWQQDLPADARRQIVGTPGLVDMATLVGYDVLALATQESRPDERRADTVRPRRRADAESRRSHL